MTLLVRACWTFCTWCMQCRMLYPVIVAVTVTDSALCVCVCISGCAVSDTARSCDVGQLPCTECWLRAADWRIWSHHSCAPAFWCCLFWWNKTRRLSTSLSLMQFDSFHVVFVWHCTSICQFVSKTANSIMHKHLQIFSSHCTFSFYDTDALQVLFNVHSYSAIMLQVLSGNGWRL